MDNLKFIYLYRDGSNYKNWAEIVFRNPDKLLAGDASKILRTCFETDLFIAHQIQIPEVFSFPDGELTFDDHCYHEFFNVESTLEDSSDLLHRSMDQFLCDVSAASKVGWRAFERKTPFEHSHTPTV